MFHALTGTVETSHPVSNAVIEYRPSSSSHWFGMAKLDKGLAELRQEFILMNLNGGL